ncbi:dienelactone hydrolase family protein [Nioella aestuarii]|uniref:dienelactone hydrolase family protein n=1 Tax=Nioella aestuarii TaxID=1662864 RepID=UPI003D7FE078
MTGAALRDRLTKALGAGFPGASFRLTTSQGTRDCHGWILEDLLFETAAGESIPAFFLRPPDGHAPVPALVYCHAHGNRYTMGREELVEGRPSLQGAYAGDLVDLGVAALCLDMPCFGGRQLPSESERAKAALWRGETLFGQMLAEQMAGLSFLADHPSVQGDRLGALGFSMGSTLAWWLAAMDDRVRAASALCSFADLETLVDLGAHDGHGIYMSVPGLLPIARSGQIAGLSAPRALQICVGLRDWSTPEKAFSRGRSDLEAAYDGQPGLAFHVEPETAHAETQYMRAAVLQFLSEQLVRGQV